MIRKILFSLLVLYFLGLTMYFVNAAEILPKVKPLEYISHSRIILHIKQNEGFRSQVYLDTRGFKTVGYGHKLPKKTQYQVGDFVSMERINRWFRADYNSALYCARRYLKNDYNHEELTVITDMAFNLGCKKLYSFFRLRKHINNKDYKMAIRAIRGSIYYNQVTNRAERNIRLLKKV